MGTCSSKPSTASRFSDHYDNDIPVEDNGDKEVEERTTSKKNSTNDEIEVVKKSPFFLFYSPSPAQNWFSKKSSLAKSPSPKASSNSTPRRFFKRLFPPLSLMRHIKSVLARRHGSVKPNETAILEGNETKGISELNKSFGFSKHFGNKYELGEEVGRGHFGYTCKAKFKRGELKGQQVVVKIIPKSKRNRVL